MNFYTLAARFNKDLDKKKLEIDRRINIDNPGMYEPGAEAIEIKNAERTMQLEFKNNCLRGLQLMEKFREIQEEFNGNESKIKRTFFITIRPNEKLINFEDFYKLCEKYCNYACFEKIINISFEQKGIISDDLGKGFHVHLVAKMTFRSKGECLRHLQSAFKICTAPNCINVQICASQKEIDNAINYSRDYISADGHKTITKDIDVLWREKMKLKDFYEGPLPPLEIKEIALSSSLAAISLLKNFTVDLT